MPPRRSNRVKAQDEVVEVPNPNPTKTASKTTKAKAPKATKATKTTKAKTSKASKPSKSVKKTEVIEIDDEVTEVEKLPESNNIVEDVSVVQTLSVKDSTIEKAVAALSKWNKDQQDESNKKSLFEEDDNDLPLYLSVTSNKYFTDTGVIKPRMLAVPHPIYDLEDARVCLFVKDDLFDTESTEKIEELKESDLKNLSEIITVKDLKTIYKSYESRRKLLSQYDIFLTDASIANMIPKLLGKIFFESPKFPLTINITDKKSLSIEKLIRNFNKALNSLGYMLPMGTNASFKLGMLGQDIKHLKENIHTITKYLERFSIRLIQLRLATSPSLPIFINKKIYTESDILDEKNDSTKEAEEELPFSIYAEGLKELGLDEEKANRLFGAKRHSSDTEPKAKKSKKN